MNIKYVVCISKQKAKIIKEKDNNEITIQSESSIAFYHVNNNVTVICKTILSLHFCNLWTKNYLPIAATYQVNKYNNSTKLGRGFSASSHKYSV